MEVGGCCLFVLLDLQNNICKNVRVLSSDNLQYMNQTFGAIFLLKFNKVKNVIIKSIIGKKMKTILFDNDKLNNSLFISDNIINIKPTIKIESL